MNLHKLDFTKKKKPKKTKSEKSKKNYVISTKYKPYICVNQ